MGLAQAKFSFDLESYLEWEGTQEERHEFHRGEVFAMVGARLPHQRVLLSAAVALKAALHGSACRVYPDSTKLRIEADDAVLYPDVMVTCDARDRGSEDRFVSWPLLIVEVLSESTAAYDRGAKFALYRKIDTLREYLVIDYATLCVELFRKNAEGLWVLHDFTGGDRVELASVAASIPIAALFEDLAAGEAAESSGTEGA